MRMTTVHQEATSLFFVQPTLSSRSWFVWQEEACPVSTELPSFTSTGGVWGGQDQSTPLMEKGSPWRYGRRHIFHLYWEKHERTSLIWLHCSGSQMHIVHIKEPYGSLAEAEHDMGGIALLAFLFEVMLWDMFTSIITVNTDPPLMFLIFSVQEAAEDHPHLDTIITALGRVQNNGTIVVTRR